MATVRYKVELPDGTFIRHRDVDAFEAWKWLTGLARQKGLQLQVAATGQILNDVSQLRCLVNIVEDCCHGDTIIRLRLVENAGSFRLARDMVDKTDTLRTLARSNEENLGVVRDLYDRDNAFRPKQDRYMPAFATEDGLYAPSSHKAYGC